MDSAPKFIQILKVLSRHEVEFILVGGLAATVQGAPVVTFDLDIVFLKTAENLARLLAALQELDARYLDPAGRHIVPDADKLAGLSLFWSEVRTHFPDFDRRPDLDWDTTYKEFIPRVLAASDTFAYYRELQAFCARIADSHTNVYFPERLQTSRYSAPPVADTEISPGRHVFTAEFESAGRNPDPAMPGFTGTLTLYSDHTKVGQGEIVTQPGNFCLVGDGICIGRDSASPVSPEYTAPFEFTGGTIDKVVVDVSGEKFVDHEKTVMSWFAID